MLKRMVCTPFRVRQRQLPNPTSSIGNVERIPTAHKNSQEVGRVVITKCFEVPFEVEFPAVGLLSVLPPEGKSPVFLSLTVIAFLQVSIV
jgi:hypothetical protein